jgi:putative ABC transport system permease protein
MRALRQAVAAVDPHLPVSYEMSFDDVLRETFARPREMAWLVGAFAGLALLLSAIGVYGVMSFLTTTRAREIGIRVALGATRRNVVALVVGDAMRLAAAGGAIGFAAAPFAIRPLSAAVYGIGPWEPVIAGAVTILLAAICFAASAVPAWRAARSASASFR